MNTDDKLRDYLKKVTLELRRTQARLQEIEEHGGPIAIVGLSCRAPERVDTPDAFWELLANGRDGIGEFPTERGWDVDALYDPALSTKGKSYVRRGGFLREAADFDPAFFGISPREALATDPQQRLLLETAWEALEDLGVAPPSLIGSATGVFVGLSQNNYSLLGSAPELEGYVVTGSSASVASGRIAYTLGLQGPAVTVDTACSASLVALHLAVQSLRRGECEIALAGGAAVLATPDAFVEFSRQRALSPEGYCKPFSKRADGTAWGEAAGMLVLERLSDALRFGHPIRAVIRGSAVNQDGKSQGLTAPNGLAQQQVIRTALRDAGLSAADVDAVEAHGTGTTLGDPIEAEALIATYGQGRAPDAPLRLGSVKANIGHTQAAAGVMGVIKLVLALERELLPRSLHADEATPHVDWAAGAVELLASEQPWPRRSGRPRRAGVSSFGISGTNAHLILEESPQSTASPLREPAASEGPWPFVLSARSEAALRAQAARVSEHLSAHPELALSDLAHSLVTTRAVHEVRAVAVAAERDALFAALAALATGEPAPALSHATARTSGKLVFVFPGQGGQWLGMARELTATSAVFAETFAACERALAPHVDFEFAEALAPDAEAMLQRIDVVQPVLFSVMVSLAALWRAHGIVPDAVVGHSQGEIAAACVAGALSLEDAAKVVALRSRAMRQLTGLGGMAVVELSGSDLAERLSRFDGRLSIAAVNSPGSAVVTGELEPLEALLEELSASGIFARRVLSSVPGHCALTERIEAELARGLGGLLPRTAAIPVYSTVHDRIVDGTSLDASYWYRNARDTVRFADAIAGLAASGHLHFVEVSAHPVLTQAVESTVRALGQSASAVGTLRRDQGGLARFLSSLAELFVCGGPVDFAHIVPAAQRVALPSYPFQRERFWLEGDQRGSDVASAGLASAEHPLLGASILLADGQGAVFTGRLSAQRQGWLAEHVVHATTILPGTAFVELAWAAASRLGLAGIEELTLEAPLVLPERGALQLQLTIGAPDAAGARSLGVHSRREDSLDDAGWTRHASGTLGAGAGAPTQSSELFRNWPPPGAAPLELSDVYERLTAIGIAYGPSFRGLRAAYRRGDLLFAEVQLPDGALRDAPRFGLHPALLDAALHVLALDAKDATVSLPFAWQAVTLHATGATALRVCAQRDVSGQVSLSVADDAGELVATVGALHTRTATASQLRRGAIARDGLYRLDWTPASAVEPRRLRWVTVGTELTGAAAHYADLPALFAALDAGAPAPEVVVAPYLTLTAADAVVRAHTAATELVALLQAWLADARSASIRCVVATRDAVAASARDRASDLAHAPLWGLVRAIQSEYPDSPLALLDLDRTPDTSESLATALATPEPQLALRDGELRRPRLSREVSELAVPDGDAWSLQIQASGTIEGLALAPLPRAPLREREVRVAVSAAGLNFRDVLASLGMYPGDPGPIGSEGAGVVVEVGEGVTDLALGERVMGLWPSAFGPFAVAPRTAIVPIPRSLRDVDAASVPAVFLTAYYGLFDLGGLRAGERVLIHAGAGGVGMAAIQLAQQAGAEVFSTASPSKWATLRALGLPDDHIASSRTLDFEVQFRAVVGATGFDVVLNSLAHEFTDASLRLLASGGRFIDMSKTDLRDPERIARDYAAVTYRAFVLGEASAERVQSMLCDVVGRFERGQLRPLPVTVWDVRRAPEAFRFMAQARHVGKIVLSVPRSLDTGGTVLITGGTGALGAQFARHLVAAHGVRHLLLCSRRGGGGALRAELEALGASVRIEACDVSDRAALEALLASIPDAHPLGAVIHAAGALDDGVLAAQSGARIESVFGPKLDAAFHLHELTRDCDLRAFVLCSSAAGVLGAPGQANYAAANAGLDALAQHRRALGLPATSLAWGYWGERGGMSGHLDRADLERMARAGIQPLSTEEGLQLFDAAWIGADPLAVPVRFAPQLFAAEPAQLPLLLRGLARPRLRRAAESTSAATSLAAKLVRLAPEERTRALLDAVLSAVTTVMGLAASRIDPERPLRDLGLDSLMAVELRNRLAALCGLRLPSTLLFDQPTPAALCRYLDAQLAGGVTGAAPRPARALAADAEPIAIVAMSCRYPGGVDTPEALWALLDAGVDAISDFPSERGWDSAALYDPDPDALGKTIACRGGFLRDVMAFDPAFFGISPREALAIDPQQRLLLETAWEALERAGLPPSELQGSATGVFVGLWQSSYPTLALPPELEGHLAAGMSPSIASGRIAYTLGLQGPAVTVDTACSSSLVALHLACQSLRQAECDLALAGGATVIATPSLFVTFSRQRVMAPDGRCKAFSDGADGAGWSEGVGMLVLERLSDAQRHGHPVLALVRGSAINQDGKSQGLTAPNGPAQERVIRQALANAQLLAAEVDVVEGHGTGTALGDPIEAQALLATYGAERDGAPPLRLGSLKSNLGHTQAAAGVGGVMKLMLALQHERLPKTLHAEQPTREVDWSSGAVALLQEPAPWPRSARPRRAGVSSFGISGTNAHVLIEEPPAGSPEAPRPALEAEAWLPFLLSATTDEALQAQAARLREHLAAHVDLHLADVAHSLVATRTAFDVRAVIVARNREALLASLGCIAAGKPDAAVARGRARRSELAFLLTGQGSQRPEMGRALYEHDPEFRRALEAVFDAFAGKLERPLRELMFAPQASADAALLEQTGYAQPALFALEVALYRALERFGVRAQYLLGHSLGELVAAHLAGVMTLEDACTLVAARARLMQELPPGGAMLALDASEAELTESLQGYAERLSIAALNGPNATVVSGEEAAIAELEARWHAAGRKAHRLAVSHAFHSKLMAPMLAPFATVLERLPLSAARVPIVSNLTGACAEPDAFARPGYWLEQVHSPVRFEPGVRTLRALGVDAFLELGPQAALSALVQASEGAQCVAVLRKGRDEVESFLLALGGLHAAGQHVDWSAVLAPVGGRTLSLPTYAFQRERYWPSLETEVHARDVLAAGLESPDHPLLGASVSLAGGEGVVLTGRLSLATHPWLAGHALLGTVILPGTGFVELAWAAARHVGLDAIEELTLLAPLPIPERGGVHLQLSVGVPEASGTRALGVFYRADDASDWTRCASATLGSAQPFAGAELATWPPEGAREIELDALYAAFADAGLAYSGAFRGLSAAYRRGDDVFAEARLPETAVAGATYYGLHPALFDAALHVLALVREPGTLALPFSWRGASLRVAGSAQLRVQVSPRPNGEVAIALADGSGLPIGWIEALSLRPVSEAQIRAVSAAQNGLYALEWLALPAPAAPVSSWLQLGAASTSPAGQPNFPDVAALVAALDAGEPVPELAVLTCAAPLGELATGARESSERLLAELQAWLGDARLAGASLVICTCGAVAAGAHDRPSDLARSPIWGLVRTAQVEYPDSDIRLLDLDETPASRARFAAALAEGSPQLALRDGQLRAPRLSRARIEPTALPNLARGTVLVTGGTGALGRRVAEHVIARHGVTHLVLCSRSGRDDELRAQLEALGASVTIAACDVSQRADLAALLDAIPAEQPLCAVIHAAGVLDDGVFASQSPERIARVFGPKLDAAVHLHELTRDRALEAFVSFSSVAGVLGSPGQANYAAANAFLDALAAQRRAEGLPAISIGWGYWEAPGGMTSHLAGTDRARIRRAGLRPLSTEHALALFDAALASDSAQLVAANLAARALAAAARQPSASASPLRVKLAGASAEQRASLVQASVLAAVSGVLGVQTARIEAERPVSELGLDSLTAVELRNQLALLSGLRLPATLLFDHPTPGALARFIAGKLAGERSASPLAARESMHRDDEPIAIVAMSCRYPGGANSPEALWELLSEGRDAIGDFPGDRGWDAAELYDPNPEAIGKTVVTRGGFLHEAADFDPAFFGIAPREALATDPQQRLLLETVWEALERAGIDPGTLHGSLSGVFVGIMYNDYAARFAPGTAGALEGYLGVGSAPSVASGRIAYSLGLQGPAITVDTACSSSLVTLHLACRALQQRECDLALAGGATVMATPAAFVEFSRQRGLALDGRCKSFSANADGVAWSEGVGMLALERLSDARKNGHPVLALVRGSAVNQDGKSQGLTAPNGPAQEHVIAQALANARLSAREIDAVEGHGTGTTLGDPIEAQALLATYGADRPSDRPLWLGSLKSNLGHTQAAAGVGGVIKMVLALQHELLPRTLHALAPTTHVDWTQGAVKLLQDAVPWAPNGQPRRAGVSSFGIGGTNAHVILEEAPADQGPSNGRADLRSVQRDTLPFLLSGKTEAALQAQADRLRTHLAEQPDLVFGEVAHALATQRAAFDARAVVLAADAATLSAALAALAAGEPSADVVVGHARPAPLALLFSGQGSQRPQLGLELYARFAPFRDALDGVFLELGDFEPSLREVMFAPPGSAHAALLDTTAYTQPALFALEVALYRLLAHSGVRPAFLLGHSVGEIAAAHVAGVFSLGDACTLVAARARLMQALPAGGAMLSLEAEEDELSPWLGPDTGLSLAAVNGARSIVVSGDARAVAELQQLFAAQGRKHRRLAVSHAFHSAHMDPMLGDFERVVRRLTLQPAERPIVSNVTGELADPALFADPGYWVEHVRAPVRFYAGLRALQAAGAGAYLELGPQPVLSTLAEEALPPADDVEAPYVGSALRKDRCESDALLRALAQLHVNVGGVQWKSVFGGALGRAVPLPTYAFQRSRYWLASAARGQDAEAVGLASSLHPLLGAHTALADGSGVLFTGRLSRTAHAELATHGLFDRVLLSSGAILDLALSAGQRVGLDAVDTLAIDAPPQIPERGSLQLQLALAAPDAQGNRTLALHVRSDALGADGPFTRCATGQLSAALDTAPHAAPLAAWPPPGSLEEPLDGVYEALAERGLSYAPGQRVLRSVHRLGDDWYAALQLPESAQADAARCALHPALFEGATQLLALKDRELALPATWRGVQLRATGATELRVRLRPNADGSGAALLLADVAGEVLGEVAALSARSVPDLQQAAGASAELDDLYAVSWVETAVPHGLGIAWATLGDMTERTPPATVHYPSFVALRASLDAGEPAPSCVVVTWISEGEGTLDTLHGASKRALELVQHWLADERLASTQLVVLTSQAVAAGAGDDVVDLAHAPLWGLLRTAQSEFPDAGFKLIDVDGHEASCAVFARALSSQEPQLALRAGQLRAARLSKLAAAPQPPIAAQFASEGTVLITGGSGALAARVARHLVVQHAVRHVLLCSRTGRADALAAELTTLGARVRVLACDVSDRDAVRALLAAIPPEHPLTAVFHTAGVTHDAVLSSLDPARLARVFAPKVDGAWHLHELTRQQPLAAFVLYSSLSGVLGGVGQANYAAANAFLDALAQHRKQRGLPASALAWGYWAEHSALSAHVDEVDRARISRAGIEAMPPELALSLLDAALGRSEAALVPARFNLALLREAESLPSILHGLVRGRMRRANRAVALKSRLASLTREAQTALMFDVVRLSIATITNVVQVNVKPNQPVRELGLDSLMALELRKHLSTQTGLRLPASLLFDYPTPVKLARHLHAQLLETLPNAATPVLAELNRLEALLAALDASARREGPLAARLDAFARSWLAPQAPAADASSQSLERALRHADDDELYALIDKSLSQ